MSTAGPNSNDLTSSNAEWHTLYADLGPFYDSEGAGHHLGDIPKSELEERVMTGSVLRMQTQDGTWLYPGWQFTGHDGVYGQMVPVLVALRGLDGWVAARWLMNSHADLDGRSPREALREGVDSASVARLAAIDAALLTS